MWIKHALVLGGAALVFVGGVQADEPDFYQYWGDGKAEISSYEVVQMRYGEAREGRGVLVFVTEDINRKTLVKVESPTPAADRLYTLKLNNVLKFNTGIYDYSVMTSVFSQVQGEAGDFAVQKITFSAQEWCGHVFEEVRRETGKLHGELNSYFEREGKQDYSMDLPEDFASGDNLLIRLRELRGPIMEEGEEVSVDLLPGLWDLRSRHAQRELVPATLSKGAVEKVKAGGGLEAATKWTLKAGDYSKTYWIEKAYPRRVLAWEDSQGSSGRLKTTMREPYWGLHDNKDEVYRDRLQIP
jgi:hypothetical protein